jgi:hypothetical protein
MVHRSNNMFSIRNIVKAIREHLYVYLGWNGFIFALDFDFRGNPHSIEIMLGHYWYNPKDEEW